MRGTVQTVPLPGVWRTAFMAETVRGDLQSVSRAQHEAALSLGPPY